MYQLYIFIILPEAETHDCCNFVVKFYKSCLIHLKQRMIFMRYVTFSKQNKPIIISSGSAVPLVHWLMFSNQKEY